MKIKDEEIKNISNKLSLLLFLFQQVLSPSTFSSIPKQIRDAVIGDNKMFCLIDKSIEQVAESDLYGITDIGDYAFYNCFNLENIIIPDNVTTIGYNAFTNCESLTNIYLKPITPPTLGNTTAIPSTTTIHVPVGSGNAYKSATNWSAYSSKIVEDIVIENVTE